MSWKKSFHWLKTGIFNTRNQIAHNIWNIIYLKVTQQQGKNFVNFYKQKVWKWSSIKIAQAVFTQFNWSFQDGVTDSFSIYRMSYFWKWFFFSNDMFSGTSFQRLVWLNVRLELIYDNFLNTFTFIPHLSRSLNLRVWRQLQRDHAKFLMSTQQASDVILDILIDNLNQVSLALFWMQMHWQIRL